MGLTACPSRPLLALPQLSKILGRDHFDEVVITHVWTVNVDGSPRASTSFREGLWMFENRRMHWRIRLTCT